MIKKKIGTVPVKNGVAEYIWEIEDNIKAGKRKIYVTYIENDGYMAGEAWENAYIRIPTNTILANEEIICKPTTNTANPETIQLEAIINTTTTLEPVNTGKIQFQIKKETSTDYINIGTPVTVTDGSATYTYDVPDTPGTKIEYRAIYLANNTYGSSTSDNTGIITIKGMVELEINDINTSAGQTENIIINIKDYNDKVLDKGEAIVYLDNTRITRIQSITTGKIEFQYTFPETIHGGEHILRVEYQENDEYITSQATSQVYIKYQTHINEIPVYAPQTITYPDGNIIKGIASIPVQVLDEDDNGVTLGTVTLSIGETNRELLLDTNGECITEYDIQSTYKGGDKIPYTLTYEENEYYSSTSLDGEILIKYITNVTLEGVEGNIGDNVQLIAHVSDENGLPVNSGEVEFSLEDNNESTEDNGEDDKHNIVEDLDEPVDDEF